MTRTILLFLTLALVAQRALAQTQSVCVKIRTEFVDSKGGDFFETNTQPRRARGAQVRITTSAGSSTHYLAGNGCANLPVPATDRTFTMLVDSKARVNDIDIFSWSEDFDSITGLPVFTLESRAFTVNRSMFTQTHFIAAHPTYENLAIAMWAMHRNTFNLGTHSTRGCCYSAGGAITDDGLCSGSNTDTYDDWPGGSDTVIDIRTKFHSPSCCGSKFTPNIGGPERTGVDMASSFRRRWPMAHELGHVIVMERMGDRTRTLQSASLFGHSPPFLVMDEETQQCMGNWKSASLNTAVADNGGPLTDGLFVEADTDYPVARSDYHGFGGKATMSMEFQSSAAREGWADFFSAWLFNKRTESDCVTKNHQVHDLDLDGDIDNNYGLINEGFRDDLEDGMLNCEGAGPGGAGGDPFPGDPLATFVTARDWLGDMVGAGACVAPQGLSNRGVQYDWNRYWWDMTTDEGVVPHQLADVYVDMCPTNWNNSDSGPVDGFPRWRLDTSMSFHGLSTKHDNQKNNGVDR